MSQRAEKLIEYIHWKSPIAKPVCPFAQTAKLHLINLETKERTVADMIGMSNFVNNRLTGGETLVFLADQDYDGHKAAKQWAYDVFALLLSNFSKFEFGNPRTGWQRTEESIGKQITRFPIIYYKDDSLQVITLSPHYDKLPSGEVHARWGPALSIIVNWTSDVRKYQATREKISKEVERRHGGWYEAAMLYIDPGDPVMTRKNSITIRIGGVPYQLGMNPFKREKK